MIDGILHLTGSSCRVFSCKTNFLWPKTNIEMNYTKEKLQGIPLNPCSQCWYVGDLSYLDPGLKLSYLDVFRIGISTLTAGVAGDWVCSRHQSSDSSSVFRFNPPYVYQSSPLVHLPDLLSFALGWQPMFSNGHPWVGIQYTQYEDSIAHFAGVRPWHQF